MTIKDYLETVWLPYTDLFNVPHYNIVTVSTRRSVNESQSCQPSLALFMVSMNSAVSGFACNPSSLLQSSTNYLYITEYRDMVPTTTPQAQHSQSLFNYSCSEIRAEYIRSHEYKKVNKWLLPAQLSVADLKYCGSDRQFWPAFITPWCRYV